MVGQTLEVLARERGAQDVAQEACARRLIGGAGAGFGVEVESLVLGHQRADDFWATTVDTSDGCVGLAKDEEMQEIAKWVRTAKARRIELR